VGSSMMTTVCGEDAPDLPISGNQLATRCHNSHAPKNSIVAAGQLRNENQNFGTIFQSCVSKIQHNDGRRARSINRDRLDPRRALRVRWCPTVFIFCVTPHSFGFSQFLLLNREYQCVYVLHEHITFRRTSIVRDTLRQSPNTMNLNISDPRY